MTHVTERGALDLAALYRDHRDDVYRFLRRRCGQPTLAEDLTQDTFERVARWATSHQWQDRGRHPLAMLFTTAGNLLRDHRRSHQRRETPHSDFTGDAAALWSAARPPLDELVADQLHLARWRHILTTLLTAQQRRVLHMTFAQGLSDRDIGHELGLHPNAVRACRHRALQRLRASAQVLELVP